MSSILIICPQWVGDLVMSQVLFKCLKLSDPKVHIDVVVPRWGQPIIDAMPEVHHAYVLQAKHGKLGLTERFALARTLKKQRYDQAIVLPGSFKSALLPWLAGIPVRTGWRGEFRYGLLNDMRVLNTQRYPLMIQRYAALAYPRAHELTKALPHPSLRLDSNQTKQILQKYNLTPGKVLAVCPGAAFGPSKQWPQLYLSALVQQKLSEGYKVWLLGSPKERTSVKALLNLQLANCHDLFDTSLAEMMHLLSVADGVLTNDSGAMHLAAALGRPLVATYGSTTPDHTPPLTKPAAALKASLPCSPCFERECRFGHYNCMQAISPAQVSTALSEVTA